jgi:hypothetical protein
MMTYYSVISGPIAPYSNLPIEPQWYQPSQFNITALSYGSTTTVTMANGTNGVSPNYVVGQQIRLTIPSKYGARQLNEKTGYVISVPTSSSVVVSINSSKTDPFIPSPTFLPMQSRTPAQIMAIGDINSGPINAQGRINNGTYIPGSFIDISPL